MPKWLFPIKCSTEFLDMKAGEGRNQSLFNYILTLQANDYSVEEARETIRIINKYILKDPLSESELDVILRDSAFHKPIFFKGQTFLHDKFATYIKNNNRIIKINGQLYVNDSAHPQSVKGKKVGSVGVLANFDNGKHRTGEAEFDCLPQRHFQH